MKNEASVIGQSLANAPGAIWDEISNHWDNDKDGLLARGGVSFGLGAGAGLLLARTPRLGGFTLGMLGVYQGLRLLSGVGSVMGRAWDADTETKRGLLVNEATTSLGREGALMLETAPAFMVGGAGAISASRRIAALDSLAFKVADKVSWVGPGTERLPQHLLASDGKINVLGIAEYMARRHQWEGVEVGRSIRLADLKAGRPATGTARGFEAAFPDQPGRLVFHSHPPEVPTTKFPVAGARPSVYDVIQTMDTGVIQSGQLTTIYKGAAQEVLAITPGQKYTPKLQAVVIDRASKMAVELENVWNPVSKNWAPAQPRILSYADTLQTLSKWDRSWSSIKAIPTLQDPNWLSPSFLKLMKLGLYET